MTSAQTASTTSQPDWHAILRNAVVTPPTHPRYAEAMQVARMAADSIRAHAGDFAAAAPPEPGPGVIPTAVVNFGQGASLGAAAPIGNAMTMKNALMALPALAIGSLPGAGIPMAASLLKAGSNTQNTDYLAASREAHPFVAAGADLAGTAALGAIASPIVAGLSPAVGTAVLGGALGAGRGAIEPIPGFTRAESAALAGGIGAVSGAILGKFVGKVGPIIRTVVRNTRGLLGASAAPADIAAATEQAIRAQLGKLKVPAEMIERAVESWKTTGGLSVKGMTPTVETPVSVRPGETVVQTVPKRIPDPLDVPTFMRRGTLAPQIGGGGFAVPGSPEAIPPTPQPLGNTPGQPMFQLSQQDAARNAYNSMIGMGTTPEAATAGARNVAGFHAEGHDPRQALLLALLLGRGQQQ